MERGELSIVMETIMRAILRIIELRAKEDTRKEMSFIKVNSQKICLMDKESKLEKTFNS